MADAYSYPLLVELGENNTPKLQNKLVIYFQSSKKSHGGDCVVDFTEGSGTAVLRFRREEDRQNVLRKESHQITLGQGVLKMTVRLPTQDTTAQEALFDNIKEDIDVAVKSKKQRTDECKPSEVQLTAQGSDTNVAEEEESSTLAILGNIPEEMNQEFLGMLVENVLNSLDSPSVSQSFTLELFPDISSAVVTFESVKESKGFVMGCPENRMFKKKELSVQLLEITEQVMVENIQNFSEELLQLYFENAGGDVEDILLNEEEQSAIITFKDHKAVQKVMKKNHQINKEEIKVYPYYKSLGKALYGEEKPSLKLPPAISEPVDNDIWRYLSTNQSAVEILCTHLAKHFCRLKLNQSSVCLSPEPSLLKQKDAKTIIKEWGGAVKSAFAQALSKFKSLKLHPEVEVWEESVEKIRQELQKEDVILVPNKVSGDLSVVGGVEDVNRLEQSLSEVINKINKRVLREKSSETQEIRIPPSIFYILHHDGLQDKLLQVYPELKMSFRKENQDLIITGLRDEILSASKYIFDAMMAIKKQTLKIDNYVFDLLKDQKQEELTNALLTSHEINAAVEISANRVQLLAVSETDLNEAENHLGTLLISEYIDVEDRNVLKMPEWQHLVSQLESANNDSYNRVKICMTGPQVVVSGLKDIVQRVSKELEEFLTQYAQVEETFMVKSNAIVEYIKKIDTSWMMQDKDEVMLYYNKEDICLSGSRVNVAHCMTLVKSLVMSLFFESWKVSMPGVKKFFQDKEAMFVNSLWSETSCLVQLVDETHGRQDDLVSSINVSKPTFQLQTSDGVEIAVSKADMCSYPVHAVVNASNRDLRHNGGLAGALLKAAGPQLQDECDKIINTNGPLNPGDCVITGAGGQLFCRKVIHAVGPQFDAAKPQKALAQLKRAVKGSLELAEKHSCISVALPAISRNLNFPLKLCAVTIVKAVKEYCDDKYDDNTLKKIHFVNNDDSAVQAMEAAVRQEFGAHGVGQPHQTLPSKAPKTSPMENVVRDPNCLGQIKTKEGLCITLTKGNIQHATTEVTVNTVFENLALNKGAVSNAIFSVAGPRLQQLVTANHTSGTPGDVIVTEGCQLQSKQVFHAVTPHWDKGQGTAQKTLSCIFKECLEKAESNGLTSLSFPAIGTGNLGFPKDLVAKLMLGEILTFSSGKKPKHLKEVVIILYSGDTSTVQVFSDEFKKKFPTASVGPAPASSPKRSGPFSKVMSGSGIYETKMGSVTVQVVTGDITKETSDVIVNSSNETFSLKSGVSKAILDAAGQAVEAEIQTQGAQPNSDIILTLPGNLKCKNILHLVGQTDPVKINKVVKNALEKCVKKYTSISFPAIGTGQGNVQARHVADAMLDAFIDVLSQNPTSTLKAIRIVIFQPPMLKDFGDSMQERESKKDATAPKDKGWTWGNIGSKLKSLFVSESTDKPRKEGDFVIEARKVDPACFHICGQTQAHVDSAKKWIHDLISKEQNSTVIPDNAILSFSDEDLQRIVDIQASMSVSIKIESKNGQASVTIEGLSKDVLNASLVIRKMMSRVKDEEELQKKVELVGTVAEWQYQQQGLQFQSFDAMNNFKLEQALDSKVKNVKVTVQGRDYTVTMPSGPASDNQGNTLVIKRIDKLKDEELPESWDAMPPNATSHVVTINPGTEEHTQVLNLFKATCKQNVLKIERIQNPMLWKSLEIKKRDMEQRNGHQNNERRLFHGTSEDTVAHINEHGFNRSYAGKNATCFGVGSYFAVHASYSAVNTYSRPNQKGEKFMYLCRVLTGDYTTGSKDMVTPPAKGPVSVQKYDSVVDNQNTINMFVVFHDSQAYPEYLITFK